MNITGPNSMKNVGVITVFDSDPLYIRIDGNCFSFCRASFLQLR